MNRTLRLLRLPAIGCRPGQVLVTTAFNDPQRGDVTCRAAPLLAAVLQDRLAGARPGLRVRLGMAGPGLASGRSGGNGVMFAVSYANRDGAVGGFALAAHSGDGAGLAVASRWAREWMAAVRSRRLVTAGDAPLCWGGQRAASLMREAAAADEPVHVLGHPVADRAFLGELRRLGVVSVSDLDAVPDGGRVAFPAHGASLMARAVADARGLRVADGTCPLVAAVQRDAASYAGRGDLVAVIGRAGDAAVASLLAPSAPGDRGEAVVVQTRDDVSRLAWGDGERVSFVIDPAMPASAAMPVLAALRARFPRIRGHHLDVMCDHATDQAHAMASVAADSELMLIITDSGEDADAADAGTVDAEARAAVRAVQGADARVHVVRRLADIGPDLLADATSVGLAATLGAPPGLAEQVTGALSGLGPVTVSSRSVRTRRESPLGSGPVPAGELTRA